MFEFEERVTCLFGKITDRNKDICFAYNKRLVTFPYRNPQEREESMNAALTHQYNLSRGHARSNIYHLYPDHIELLVNVVTGNLDTAEKVYLDLEFECVIKNKVWHLHKGHIVTRTFDCERVNLGTFLTNGRKYNHIDKNHFNLRLSNLQLLDELHNKFVFENHVISKRDIPLRKSSDKKSSDEKEIVPQPLTKPVTKLHPGDVTHSLRSQIVSKTKVSTTSTDKPSTEQEIIPKYVWFYFTQAHKSHPQAVLDYLQSILDIPLQFKELTLQEAMKDYELLKSHPDTSLDNNNRIGNKLSLKYFSSIMRKAKSCDHPTMETAWNTTEHKIRWIKGLLCFCDVLTFTSIQRAYALQFYKVGNFPPLIARNLYDYYFLPEVSNKRVLDFCAGFSGRLVGFLASNTCTKYVGIDPNPELHPLYQELLSTTSLEKKEVTMIQEAAEDVDYSSLGTFHIIFTSPPFFNRELYCDDSTQSIVRYPKLDSWIDNFLIATMNKVSACLTTGGILAINFKQYCKWNIDVMERVNAAMELKGLRKQECLKFGIGSRPTKAEKESWEYIHVWTRL
jgi:16S rRNA G966 N2-methylase RsmD